MINDAPQLKLYKTEPHNCSYLPAEEAITLFVDPAADIDINLHTSLSERGFRRSGNILYKPDCNHCHECISIRIDVARYQFNRSDKRILKRNCDLQVFEVEHINHDDFYDLYAHYIGKRHADGDMYPPSREQFINFFSNPFGNTRFVVFKKAENLKAVAVIDLFTSGISAVYTFFDPDDEQRSLGKLAVLWQIQQAQSLQLPYVYLGYWVKHCTKMNYKTQFHPTEIYLNKRWMPLIHKEP
jgi:arginine-tRNA-protein transferase